MGSEFILMRASAGSGKTYALSLRFVEFLLKDRESGDVPRALPNILAITFTRNAAREMKERILDWLKEGYSGKGKKAGDLARFLQIPPDELSRRAGEAVERILSGYTDFQVNTIDSFATMVFRASAVDLGYGPDFEISLDPRELLDYAFARFLRRVRPAGAEGAMFREILDYLLLQEGEKSRFLWDPTPKILDQLNEFHKKLAVRPGELVLDDCRRDKFGIGKKIRATAERLKDSVNASGLEVTSRGNYGTKIIPAIEAGNFADLIDCSFKTFPVKKGAKVRGAVADAVEKIGLEWRALQEQVGEYARFYARDFFVPYLRVFQSVQAEMVLAERSRGLLFLDDVNRELRRYIDQGIVPDIYFRLGDRIYHYLIDEFQDTSPVQWETLRPLIEESLSRGGSLFVVGDTKQAIYGFRDADYRIMRRLEEKSSGFGSTETSVRELIVNHRSDGEILRFVKDLFLGLKTKAAADSGDGDSDDKSADYSKWAGLSGLNQFEQSVLPEREERGYVRYVLLDKAAAVPPDGETETNPVEDSKEESGIDDTPEKTVIQDLVAGLRARGWRYSDIAVLASRNDDVANVASWLNEKGVDIISFSNLDIRRRKIIGEILSFLRFLDAPPDDLAFAEFLLGDLFTSVVKESPEPFDLPARREFLREGHRGSDHPYYTALRRRFPRIWDKYFEPFFKSVGYLPLYDLVTRIYREFDVFRLFPDEEAGLTKLLEAIKNFEGEGRNDLREFLRRSESEEDVDENWTIDIPRDINAVKIMSIHKAKGATIPVVVCLLYGEEFKGGGFYLEDKEDGVHVYKINKNLAEADSVLEEIYKNYRDREGVDRLNKLYVALTRAQHELQIVGVKGKRAKYPFDLLETVFDRAGITPDAVPGAARWTFERGKPCWREDERPQKEGDGEKLFYPQPVEHRTGPSREPANVRESLNSARIRRGEWIHRILAGIEFNRAGWPEEIAAVLERIRPPDSEKAAATEAGKSLAGALGKSADPDWFALRPGRLIFREFDVCDCSGNIYRMDRVIVDPGAVMIVDFKTGGDAGLPLRPEFAEENREQIRCYRGLLQDIYPGWPVRGVLAYLDQGRIEEVE